MNKFDLVLIHPLYHRRIGSSLIFPLGLGYIAASAIKRGFSVKIIDSALYFNSLKDDVLEKYKTWLYSELAKSPPNFAIGIGPCTTSAVRSIKIISAVCKSKFPSIPLIYGGPLASIEGQVELFFKEFQASVVVPGDGEYVINEILSRIKQRKPLESINSIFTPNSHAKKTNIIQNLDNLEFPFRFRINDYSLSARRDLFASPFATVVSSRGCPFTCSFCVSGHLRNKKYHRRTNSNLKKELENLQSKYGVKTVVFYDDTFFPSPATLEKNVESLATSMKKLSAPLKWQIEVRPDILQAIDPHIIKLLFNSGCRQINVGIEKGDDSDIMMEKKINFDEVKKALRTIKREVPDMRLTATFIFGGPNETDSKIKDTIDYALSLDLLFAHFYPLEIYPGTKLFKMKYSGKNPFFWYESIMNDLLPWGEVVFENENINCSDLLKYISLAYKKFYNRESWHSLAQSQLGSNYKRAAEFSELWVKDRFALV